MSEQALRQRVQAVIEQHGGIRPAARALKMDAAYLQRLAFGGKQNPSDAVLRKFGMKRVVTFVPIKRETLASYL
jgi:hypothetical protein